MANNTTYYGLTKPLAEEFYDIDVQNENMDIIDRTLKGKADLGADGKIPAAQLPSMNYISTEQKGIAGGVATLGADKKVPANQLPEIKYAHTYSAVLSVNSWTEGSDGRYYQAVSVSGVATDTELVIVDCDLTTDDADARIEILTAWAVVSANEADQGAGIVTFYSYTIPTVSIPIFVGVV